MPKVAGPVASPVVYLVPVSNNSKRMLSRIESEHS
jgi:hypothetical protein